MASGVGEKTEEELRKEIDELHRQQREITERLRDPRGLRRGGAASSGPRNFASNGVRHRGFVRSADAAAEDQPPPKRRLSSAIVKVENGQMAGTTEAAEGNVGKDQVALEGNRDPPHVLDQGDRSEFDLQQPSWFRTDGNRRPTKNFEPPVVDHVPRVLPKNEDPTLVNRNKRMLGRLLGTLEKFRKEDVQLSGSDAFMRRSYSLQRAEERAREESERLRQQEREQIAEKRRRDLTLRARVAAKAEEKKLELLFLQWSVHHEKLCNFQRTKAEPSIHYSFTKPLVEDATLTAEKRQEDFQEWKAARREELSDYQKQIGEQYIANVEKELEKWQNARRSRKVNNDKLNLQQTMDQELETHRLEHGPKPRKISAGSNNEDEDDVEDINVVEDDMMDDVLGIDDNGTRGEELTQLSAGDASPQPDNVVGPS